MSKQPRLSQFKLDMQGTRKMRDVMAKTQKIKITINLDTDLIGKVRELAQNLEMPYQRYLNRVLREALQKKSTEITRLDRLEKEMTVLKKKLAA